MRTLTNIAIITLTIASSVFAKSNDKFYQVTDNGKYQYTYWMEEGNDNPKASVKPVTLRTFFLETSKVELLPKGMTYSEFVKLSLEEKQNIISTSQYETIVAIESEEEINNQETTVTESLMNAEETATTEDINEGHDSEMQEELSTVTKENYDNNLPWIIRAMTNVYAGIKVPSDKIEITVSNNELPWVVDAVVNHGEFTTMNNIAKNLEIAKSLKASK